MKCKSSVRMNFSVGTCKAALGAVAGLGEVNSLCFVSHWPLLREGWQTGEAPEVQVSLLSWGAFLQKLQIRLLLLDRIPGDVFWTATAAEMCGSCERNSRTAQGWVWFSFADLHWHSGHLHSPPWSAAENLQPAAPVMDTGGPLCAHCSCLLGTIPGFSRNSAGWSPWGWDRKGCYTQSTAGSAGLCCVPSSGVFLYAQELPGVPWMGQSSNLGAGSLQCAWQTGVGIPVPLSPGDKGSITVVV